MSSATRLLSLGSLIIDWRHPDQSVLRGTPTGCRDGANSAWTTSSFSNSGCACTLKTRVAVKQGGVVRKTGSDWPTTSRPFSGGNSIDLVLMPGVHRDDSVVAVSCRFCKTHRPSSLFRKFLDRAAQGLGDDLVAKAQADKGFAGAIADRRGSPASSGWDPTCDLRRAPWLASPKLIQPSAASTEFETPCPQRHRRKGKPASVHACAGSSRQVNRPSAGITSAGRWPACKMRDVPQKGPFGLMRANPMPGRVRAASLRTVPVVRAEGLGLCPARDRAIGRRAIAGCRPPGAAIGCRSRDPSGLTVKLDP